MMTTFFYNTETKEYPRYAGDLFLLGWSQGSPLPEGWVEVFVEDEPTVDYGHNFRLLPPELDDSGHWVARYTTWEMTDAEKEEAAAIRALAQQLNIENILPTNVAPEQE